MKILRSSKTNPEIVPVLNSINEDVERFKVELKLSNSIEAPPKGVKNVIVNSETQIMELLAKTDSKLVDVQSDGRFVRFITTIHNIQRLTLRA